MRQIEENIRKRRDALAYSSDAEALIAAPLQPASAEMENFQDDIYQIKTRWDVRAGYDISSHRSIIGKILVFGRRMVNGEVRRYVDPIIGNQVEFNSHIARILSKTWCDSKEERGMAGRCRHFEGSPPSDAKDVLHHLNMLLDYFRGCSDILVIGRGHSEMVPLMENRGLSPSEIDLLENGMKDGSIKSHLASQKDGSLDGVFCDYSLEYIAPSELHQVLGLCHTKMKPGAYFISNCVNPALASLLAGSCLPGVPQSSPINPRAIRSLLESSGFRGVQIEFFDLPPEECRLSRLVIDESASGYERENLEITNRNIMKLNSLLYGPKSYSAIAER